MVKTVGARQAEALLVDALMLPPPAALAVGLVDAVVPEAQLMGAADAYIATRLRLPPSSRAFVKRQLRQPLSDAWLEELPQDTEQTWERLIQPQIQKSIAAVLVALSKPKAQR